MKLHLLKLTYWEGISGRFFVGDIDAVGQVGNQWWCPARLLGLSLVEYLALTITLFDGKISSTRHGDFICYFENATSADKFCKYINKKAKQAGFYV